MATFQLAYNITSQHEGGYVNDPKDRGKATYCGISRGNFPNWKGWATIDLLKPVRGQKIPQLDSMVREFYYDNFWGRIGEIDSQAIANFVYDFKVHSGKLAIKTLQRLVSVADDGILGKGTISAVNAANEAQLLSKLKGARIALLKSIVANDPTQQRFLNGWLTRVATFGDMA